MLKALKVVMTVYVVVHVLLGLIDITMHDFMATLLRISDVPSYVNWMEEVTGAIFIALGVWIAIAARDPIQHIRWVKFAITASSLILIVSVHSILAGYVEFSQVAISIVVPVIFVVALLVCYPWRLARRGEQ